MVKTKSNYGQGGDLKATTELANKYYGSQKNMLKAHGYLEENNMPKFSSEYILPHYDSIHNFEQAHKKLSDMNFPIEMICKQSPNIWLTSLHDFDPKNWGMLGFTKSSDRDYFINNTQSGVLVVVYTTKTSPIVSKEKQGKIIGIQECSHIFGNAKNFLSPDAYKEKLSNNPTQWNYAVKATRAWHVSPESYIDIEDFAFETYSSGDARNIGSRGVRLTSQEALKILKLSLRETSVYGQNPVVASETETHIENVADNPVFSTSRAGPVSQNPFITPESEGEKHLYVLKLMGDTDAFLGEKSNGKIIVKAGFSGNPKIRCDDFNAMLPKKCAFKWEILHTSERLPNAPYATSFHAKAGEAKMHDVLNMRPDGESLGGEFFLADESLVNNAWRQGNNAAQLYLK